MAERILMNELKLLSQEKWVNVEAIEENIFSWKVALIVLNPDSAYYGGYFLANMKFPDNYPYSPPEFQFWRPIFHPNIYPDGKICISILHPPGDDEMAGETGAERWSPAQRAESVLLSILSLLDDAEINSPANVDASVMYRDKKAEFTVRVQQDIEQSKRDIPEGFVMPTHESTKPKPNEDEGDFWWDSDVESFGGSDSDPETELDEDEEEDET
ncbi:MAG: hypothetical protein M1814_006199 [Vezdaea aestivalis]|nr:MAG: hypothetical protein M1814_006199 [Vezdaea aestivalis]